MTPGLAKEKHLVYVFGYSAFQNGFSYDFSFPYPAVFVTPTEIATIISGKTKERTDR